MLEVGILKNFDSGTYKAGVQLAGSLTTYFDDISVAKNIPSSALVIGNYVIVAIPGGNPKDACIIATWPQGSPGGGMEVHGNEYHAPAFATEADLADHSSRHEIGGPDALSNKFLAHIVAASNFIMIPTNYGYYESLAGSGSTKQDPMRLLAQTGTTANSRGLLWTPSYGFNEGSTYTYITWDKKFVLIFNVARYQSDTQVVGRIQLKPAATEGSLADHGLGLKTLNYDLWGESYGTALGEVDLGVTLANFEGAQIKIVLDPGTSVKWYVNGVLKGTQSDAAKIPSGSAIARLVFSIINGATGGTNCALSMMQSKIWQER